MEGEGEGGGKCGVLQFVEDVDLLGTDIGGMGHEKLEWRKALSKEGLMLGSTKHTFTAAKVLPCFLVDSQGFLCSFTWKT